MTKYYYDCPIQALYMIKEFGVQCYIESKIISSCNLSTGEIDKSERTIEIDFEEEYLDQILGSYAEIKNLDSKIYVAKESEHIFEPKEGDKGLIDNRHCVILESDKWRYDEWISNSDPYFERSHHGKIIMRDNKQFFMPKKEENE